MLSIVVPTYNRPSKVKRLLEVLQPQLEKHRGRVEVVLVDDGGDLPVSYFSEKESGQVRFFRTERNLGPSSARNLGIRESLGSTIAFLDDDVVPARDYLDELFVFLEEYPEIQVAVGHLEALNTDIYARFWKECYESVFGSRTEPGLIYPVPMFSTGLGVVRRELLDTAGFEPLFAAEFRTGEDFDLFQRVEAIGLQVWKCDRILAYNETRNDLLSFLDQRYAYWKYGKARRKVSDPRVRFRLSLQCRCLDYLARAYIFFRSTKERLFK